MSEMTAADLVLRPATLDDAAFAADMYTALSPDDPEDPVLWRDWWANVSPDATIERYVALQGDRRVGLTQMTHSAWEKMPERYARVVADVLPEIRTTQRLDALLAFAEERAVRESALRAASWGWEWDKPMLDVLTSRGYREERRSRFWELDLVANRARLEEMSRASRERMRTEGIQVLTISDDKDPDKLHKIWRMSEEASQDVPRTVPYVEQPYEVFLKWFESPGLREDRMWIAREGDAIVGISMLSYPPVRGVVTTDWTATGRSVRGKGVARALKCETVMQAISLGIDRVRTDNDSQNKPILHINDSMGYKPRPEAIALIKDLGAS